MDLPDSGPRITLLGHRSLLSAGLPTGEVSIKSGLDSVQDRLTRNTLYDKSSDVADNVHQTVWTLQGLYRF